MLQVRFSGEQNHKEQKKQRHIMSRGETSSNNQMPPTEMKTQESSDAGAEASPCAGAGSGVAGPCSAGGNSPLS